jgi:uncharacterized membrane protein
MSSSIFSRDRRGFPLHPLLVHLPIGCWAATLVSDLIFWMGGGPVFPPISFYTLWLGLLGAVLAIPAGFAQFWRIPARAQVKSLAYAHMTLNLLVTGLAFVNYFLRRAEDAGAQAEVPAAGLGLSVLAILLLSVSGYLGSRMAFAYRVGSALPDFRPAGTAESDERRRAA